MSPSDLHLLIHFRQRWAKHDPCLLSVKAAFFSIWQNFSTDPREAESTPIQHPCKTCLVTALEEEVAFEHPSFWCLPSAWKVTATKRNSPSHLGRVAKESGWSTEFCHWKPKMFHWKDPYKDHESVIYRKSIETRCLTIWCTCTSHQKSCRAFNSGF